jgi:CheY-like chemotaxis protein
VEAPETSSAPKPVGETNYRGSETILLVEDEAKVRKVAKRILEEHGYKILDVGSGPQALELGGSYTGEIPLVITDVIMPGMGGKELAERLLASRPKIRVLFVSGYTDNIIAEHDISEKELNFLHKPFTIASLTAKVRKVLDKN